MPPVTHSKLSPSAAARWLHCTAAPTLEAEFEDPGSPYAAEGTLAHAIAELKLRKALVEPMGPRKFNAALKKLQEDPSFEQEMLGYTDGYVDYIKELAHRYASKPFVQAEVSLDLSAFVPECHGTADCILLGGNTMDVVDFKYGKGKRVDAADNPQLCLYGVGALLENALFYDIRTVRLHIYQPRLDHTDVEELTRDELLNWAAFTVRPAAAEAHTGPGTARAGEWCQFCRARGQCRAQTEQTLATFAPYKERDPGLLTSAEYAAVLPQLSALKKWATQVEDAALARLLEGENIPGFKCVEGRSNRAFSNQDAAFDALVAAGVDRELLYVRTPLTLSATEKLLGKARFEELLRPFVTKPAGAPTVAPETDRRPPYTSHPTPEEAFQ